MSDIESITYEITEDDLKSYNPKSRTPILEILKDMGAPIIGSDYLEIDLKNYRVVRYDTWWKNGIMTFEFERRT